VQDDPNNLPLKTTKIIPFDYFDGHTSGGFWKIILDSKNKTENLPRKNVVINDCKLIAQIHNRKIEGYITKDRHPSTVLSPQFLQGIHCL